MIQECAFDPQSGAPLTDDQFYHPDVRGPARKPVQTPHTEWSAGREGALTNGELRSAQGGLLGYFRRVHRDVREPDPDLDCAAALAIKQLKADEEEGRNEIDAFI